MARPSHLRDAGKKVDHSVSPLELFFDLVFVFAVTQLSHYLLDHHTLAGSLQTLVMFLAVWWAWIYTAWATNWLDPGRAPVRLVLLLVMLLSMVMSSAIPMAFGPAGLAFALAYVAIQVGRTFYTAWAREGFARGCTTNMLRATIYFAVSAGFWIAGGLDADPNRRLLWWLAALAIEYAGPSTFFFVPGLGRSTVADWSISGAHMAERAGLFIIIALGEGIIVTGATFADLEPSPANVLAFVSAFVSSVVMWWIYFDVGARRGSEMIEHDADQHQPHRHRVGIEPVGRPGRVDPGRPQGEQQHEGFARAGRRGVMDEEMRDLRDAEHVDEVEEQLDRRDAGLGLRAVAQPGAAHALDVPFCIRLPVSSWTQYDSRPVP